jgi:hypothetical protein
MRHIAVLFISAVTLQAADPALLNLVMPDAKILAGINVQKAKTTDFGQFLLKQMPDGDALTGFVTSTGFDPRQDLVEVLMASTGETKSKGLILASGKFSMEKIAAAVAKDGKHAMQDYHGARLVTGTEAADAGGLAFLSGQIAVLGDVTDVKAAIDRSGGANALDPALAAKIASLAGTDAWSVSISPGSLGNAMGGDKDNPMGAIFRSIQQASGSVSLTSPVVISVEALAQSDQDATSLSDVAKFAMQMFQGNLPAGLSNALSVTTDHSTVRLQISIPEDQLEQLIQGMKTADKKPAGAHV